MTQPLGCQSNGLIVLLHYEDSEKGLLLLLRPPFIKRLHARLQISRPHHQLPVWHRKACFKLLLFLS